MNTIKKVVSLKGTEYYERHLQLIGVFLPVGLAPMEIKTLSHFLNLPDEIVEDYRFNTMARKRVKDALHLSDASLSNHLTSMINKGYLTRSEVTNKIKINPTIVPNSGQQAYAFGLKKEEVNEA